MADTAADTAQLVEAAPILSWQRLSMKALLTGPQPQDPTGLNDDCSLVPLDGKLASSQHAHLCIADSLRVWIDVPDA